MTAQAIIDVAPAAAKLSFLHALMWFPPKNFDTIPRTDASNAKIKKNIVAPLPPKPEKTKRKYTYIHIYVYIYFPLYIIDTIILTDLCI